MVRNADTSPPDKLGWPARIALGLGVVLLFCSSLLVGVLAHADMAATRRTVTMAVNAVLSSRLMGKVELGGIELLSTDALRISNLQVTDPDGAKVLEVQGIELRGSWLTAALASNSATVLPLLKITSARLRLRLAADGKLSLQHALRARPSDERPKKPAEKPKPSARSLWLQRIELDRLDLLADELGPSKLNVDGHLSNIAASLSLDPRQLRFDLDRMRVVERKLAPVALSGELAYHLHLQRATDTPSMWGSFSGKLGELALQARGSLVDGRVALALDVPQLGERELSPFLNNPKLLAAPVRVSATLTGTKPRFRFHGLVQLPALAGGVAGEIRTHGTLVLGELSLIDMQLDARNANARLVADQIRGSRINASAWVRVLLAGEDSLLNARLRSSPSWVNGVPVPPLAGTLVAARSGLECNLHVDEPGSPADLGVVLDAAKTARFAVRASVDRLGGVERLRFRVPAALAPARWRGRLALSAAGSLANDQIDAAIDARLRGVELPFPSSAVRVGYAKLAARVRGPPAALTVEATAHGGAVAIGKRKVASFRLGARGPVRAAQLSVALETPDRTAITAHALLEHEQQRLRNVRVALERGSVQLEGAIAQVLRRPRSTRLEGISVKGLGDGVVTGSLRIERGELLGKLSAKGVALKPLGRLMDVPYPIRGHADLEVDLAQQRGRGRSGGVSLRLRDVGYLTIGSFDLDFDTALKGELIRPKAKLVLRAAEDHPVEEDAPNKGHPEASCNGVFASLEIGGDGVRLAGALLDPKSWQAATGALVVDHTIVSPRCVANIIETFPVVGELPFGLLQGKLSATLELARRAGQRLPSIERLGLRTDGLRVAARREAEQEPSWQSDRLDLSVEASLEPNTGATSFKVDLLDATTLAASAAPRVGTAAPRAGASALAGLPKLVLATLSAATKLDLARLVKAPAAERRTALIEAPLRLSLKTPRLHLARFAANLPDPWRGQLADLAGEGLLSFELDGRLAEPVWAARVRGWQLVVDEGEQPAKVDLDVLANYFDKNLRVDAALEHARRQVATWSLDLRTDLGGRIRGRDVPAPRGNMALTFDRLPLAAVPSLGRRQISGGLSGKVKLSDIGGAVPRLQATMNVHDMQLGGRVFFDVARLRIQPATSHSPGTLTTLAELAVRGGGRLQLSGYGALRWKDGLVPSANDDAPAALLLIADQFPLRAAHPLVDDVISKLGGRLHGALRLAHKERPDHKVVLGGDMRLTGGVVHIPAAGQRLHHLEARLRAAPNAIRVDDIVVQAASGRATGSFVARLNGLQLTDVNGKLVIVEGEEMPLIADGIPLGTMRGEFLLKLTRRLGKRGRPDEVNVVLTAASLHLQLPPKAGHKVQRLNDHPDVSVSHLTAAPKALPRPAGAARVFVTVGLRNGEISGHGIHIEFETDADHPIEANSDGGLRGKLKVTNGSFNVLGKVFLVDRGEVRLRSEEPGNPAINLTAHWNAPDGSIIYADYVGLLKPVTREKIRFRSNPPRSQQAIVSLLLLGDEQSSSRSAAASGAGNDRAASMARGVFATQLNDLLGGISQGLATGLGTTKDGYIATSLIYQVSEKVTAKATLERVSARQAVDADAASVSGANQTASRAKVTVDVRVAPRWLLRGSLGLVGGAASGVEVIYQLRY